MRRRTAWRSVSVHCRLSIAEEITTMRKPRSLASFVTVFVVMALAGIVGARRLSPLAR